MGKHWSFFHIKGTLVLWILLLCEVCFAGVQFVGKVSPGFKGAQMNWIDRDGKFLVSKSGKFAFGFVTTANDVTQFLLVIIHMKTTTLVWTANRGIPVANSDNFVFDDKGNAYLQRGGTVVWSTNTSGKGVSSMELQDTGNLVLFGNDNSTIIWQSFSHPTNTLLPTQEFTEGMKLISDPSPNNLTFSLEINSGNVILLAGFRTPQPYWSMQKDSRITVNKNGDVVASATIGDNSWRFYDKSKSLLWQFIFSDGSGSANGTWVAVLGTDGFITFYDLEGGGMNAPSPTRIPQGSCDTPEACDPYNICTGNQKCSCLSVLPNCKPGFVSPCDDSSKNSFTLVKADDGLSYFALDFLQPFSKTNLAGCQESCSGNCTCLAMFFHLSSGNCFLLDSIGSFEKSSTNSSYVSYIKVSSDGRAGTSGGGSSNKHTVIIVIIVILTLLVISCMIFVGFRYYRRKQKLPESPRENSEEDTFFENLTGVPIRYSYKDLEAATNNFSEKLGQGGFGSVYKGVLPDGTQVAVKKLEGIGQGKKEFRAEVSIIGSIHHLHLVRLRGFCVEGTHRLLAYEYMANGSLDKWIFKKNQGEILLDWDTRFNIALGTAKGLAYLHEDCDSKIVHCDIKPENVLLDDHFMAKVSDFGLAKLMNREQSHVFTTLRGTRGYLAPEWITNYAISEKSDVYSYGMVLLEIIAGRKNYDPAETSDKSHFPTYAFKMMEEGKLREILDSKLVTDENDDRVHTAIKVALWCIQEDMAMRPSMTKVVQMLEGLCTVPKPPTGSPFLGSRLFSNVFNPSSEGATTSSGPSDCNSDAYLSAVRLSGPR